MEDLNEKKELGTDFLLYVIKYDKFFTRSVGIYIHIINSLNNNHNCIYIHIINSLNNNHNFIATLIQSPKLFFAAFFWFAFGELAIYVGYNTR